MTTVAPVQSPVQGAGQAAIVPAVARQVCCKIMDVVSTEARGDVPVNVLGAALAWHEYRPTCGPLLAFLRRHSFLFRVVSRKPGFNVVSMAPPRGADLRAKREAFLCDLLDDTVREMGGRAMVHELAPRLRWHLFDDEFGRLSDLAERYDAWHLGVTTPACVECDRPAVCLLLCYWQGKSQVCDFIRWAASVCVAAPTGVGRWCLCVSPSFRAAPPVPPFRLIPNTFAATATAAAAAAATTTGVCRASACSQLELHRADRGCRCSGRAAGTSSCRWGCVQRTGAPHTPPVEIRVTAGAVWSCGGRSCASIRVCYRVGSCARRHHGGDSRRVLAVPRLRRCGCGGDVRCPAVS